MTLNCNMSKYMFMLYFIITFVSIYGVLADTDNEAENATTVLSTSSVTTVTSSTTTVQPNISCEAHNNDCNGCVKSAQCYYCGSTKECHFAISKDVVGGKCKIGDAYYMTCNASLKFLVIGLSVLAGVVILIILVVCCYCCCKRKGVKLSKDDIKWARQREERKQIAAERRKERAERTEEIKKKYGLVKDSNPYQRFDA